MNIKNPFWYTICPLIVKSLVAFVVEFLFIFVYSMQKVPLEILESMSVEEVKKFTVEISVEVLKYTTEITALVAVATIPIFLLMMRKDRKREEKAGIPQKQKIEISKYIYIIGMSIPFSIGMNNIIMLSDIVNYSEVYQQTAEALYQASLPMQILCLGILIPIAEECLYRGLIYRRLRYRMGVVGGAILSSFLFGTLHGNVVQSIYGLVSGILLIYIYEVYGSIKAPMVAHMVINIVACFLTEAEAFKWMFSNLTRMAIITIFCGAIAASMFLCMKNLQLEQKNHKDLPQDTQQEC